MSKLLGRMRGLLRPEEASEKRGQARGEPGREPRKRGPVRLGLRTSSTDWRSVLEDEVKRGAQPIEQACPSCGAPMLAGWGSSCGNCKPKLARPKTILLATGDLAGMLSMTLGWLVVLKTPDSAQRKGLIELTDPLTTLSRAGALPAAGMRSVSFADEYMSVGHAVLRRPQGFSRDAAFTLEDRKAPSPSANGTFLNGRRLDATEVATLADGDMVRVGTTELVFKSLWLPASQGLGNP